jgi:anti-sigma factor RsiW
MMAESTESGFGCTVEGARLAALLDNELPLPDQRALELHLRTCPRCRAELELQQRARTLLRDAAAHMEAPASLQRRVAGALAQAPVRVPMRRRVLPYAGIAAVLVLVALTGALLAAMRQSPSPQLLQRAARAHAQQTLSAAPVSFTSDSPDAVSAWVARQTGGRIDVPDLDTAGFQLAGARLDPTIAPRAVTVVYQSPAGRLSCVIVPSPLPSWLSTPLGVLHSGTETASIDRTQLAAWAAPDGTYVLAGALSPAALASLAHTARSADRN